MKEGRKEGRKKGRKEARGASTWIDNEFQAGWYSDMQYLYGMFSYIPLCCAVFKATVRRMMNDKSIGHLASLPFVSL